MAAEPHLRPAASRCRDGSGGGGEGAGARLGAGPCGRWRGAGRWPRSSPPSSPPRRSSPGGKVGPAWHGVAWHGRAGGSGTEGKGREGTGAARGRGAALPGREVGRRGGCAGTGHRGSQALGGKSLPLFYVNTNWIDPVGFVSPISGAWVTRIASRSTFLWMRGAALPVRSLCRVSSAGKFPGKENSIYWGNMGSLAGALGATGAQLAPATLRSGFLEAPRNPAANGHIPPAAPQEFPLGTQKRFLGFSSVSKSRSVAKNAGSILRRFVLILKSSQSVL